MPPARVLEAAGRLFAAADNPGAVTMEAVAAEAGVGKGTLFRAFGSREGLLDALWAARLEDLRFAVEEGAPPLGPPPATEGAPDDAQEAAVARLVAFLDALLSFKLENRQLIRAREAGGGVLQSAHYRWMHGVVRDTLQAAAPAMAGQGAIYTAHTLLVAVHIDLIEALLADGLSLPDLRRLQADRVRGTIRTARGEA
ncbi:TetR/AcrR family transcriptional regulator [Acidimangrovimonas sediminis]|uniref:TetR/AcrR family transcriptional regulator n=1 Tax=Acidimangrovimonas sediminis TaxID=2056283 RepID=UPI0018ED0487|nr:TetR/AcrR family transcriptional regulator [Acidimangrovimonas sediminis]